MLGVDPATGLVSMRTASWRRRRCPGSGRRSRRSSRRRAPGAERRRPAVDAAWHAPDPVGARAAGHGSARRCSGALRARVATFAVATSDDRGPTERTLAALGIADEFAALACADDGIPEQAGARIRCSESASALGHRPGADGRGRRLARGPADGPGRRRGARDRACSRASATRRRSRRSRTSSCHRSRSWPRPERLRTAWRPRVRRCQSLARAP